MTKDIKVIRHWIETIINEGRNLTVWETNFVESLSDQVEMKGYISDRQEEILERIYSEKTPT